MDLRSYRKLAKVSQSKMAEIMGFSSEAVVSRHENGVRYPDPEAIEKYASVTDDAVTNDDWVRLRHETDPDNPTMRRK